MCIRDRINELLKQSIKSEGVINLFSDIKEEFSLFDPVSYTHLARTKIHLQNYLNSRSDDNPALFVSLKLPHERLKIGGVEVLSLIHI